MEPFDFPPVEVEMGCRSGPPEDCQLIRCEVVVDPSTPGAAEFEVNALLDLRLDMMGERDRPS
jgi:hypothetical protein